MPKQILKLDQFHGGLNSNSDPRDIAPNELSTAVDVMVDELGKIRTMGGTDTHGEAPANVAAINPGYGLFQFSHDRTGAEQKLEHSGTYTDGSDSGTVLIDSAAAFTAGLVGGTARNLTDGSSGTVVSVDSGTQLTVDDLLGGTDNVWDASDNDAYVISWPETGDDYLVMADTDDAADIDIYSRVADAWGTSKIDLGSTTGMKPCFYAVDGALRVSDGNFGAANSNKWYGYIKRTHFSGITPGGTVDAYDGWYSKSLTLAKPTKGLYGQTLNFTDTSHPSDTSIYIEFDGGSSNAFLYWTISGQGYIATDSGENDQARIITEVYTGNDFLLTEDNNAAGGWGGFGIRIFPPAGTGWNVYLKESATTGASWPGGAYRVGTTFIYEGNQESDIFEPTDRPNSNGLETITFGNAIDFAIYATAPFDPFIIGGRVYVIRRGTVGPWVLLADISLEEGVRSDLSSDYTAWSLDIGDDDQHNNAPDNAYCFVEGKTSIDPSAYTYEVLNGYGPGEKIEIGSNGEGFKTAVVANRQAYIGNVRRENEEGEVVVQGDAMYKSIINKFDTFPLANRIEASVRDGDEIVKLEEYADRILQFKKKKLHLINVSQDLEFLEDTFMHKGVSHPAATCKTDFGIAWVNKLGCYLYDGKQVTNLLEKGGRQIIKESEWESFTTDNSAIGYIPKKRQLLIIDSVDSQYSSGNRYLYDMVTQSWVKSEKTNIIANPSFETADSPLANWTENNGTGPAVWTQATDQEYAGTYSAKCVNHANQTGSASITSDTFNLTPGKTYTLSWWGRFSIDPDPTMILLNTTDTHYLKDDMSFGSGANYPDWDLFGDADTIDTWHYYSLTFNVPSTYGATDTWVLAFYPTTTNDCATWIDDVSLIEEGNANMTNLVTDWNGDLIYAVAPGPFFKWDDTSDTTNSFSFKTKDIDFGQPGVRKKVYRVYVTYKGASDTNMDVFFDVDGGTALNKTFANGTNFTSSQLDGSSAWAVAELKPTTSSQANNIKSFRLKFVSNGTTPADFEINDISIVYRLKNVK